MRERLLPLLACYLRNTSLEWGRYRLLTFARQTLRETGHKLGKRTLRTRHGFTMALELGDWIPQDIYLTGDFESTTSNLVKKLLKPGDTVIDAGANIGYFSLLFASCVGPTGHVHAFEPVPELVEKLRANISLNRFGHITVNPFALSDHEGTARFYTGPADNSGLSSLRQPRQSRGSFDVQLRPFDTLMPESDTSVSLVKIDVEGAELQVLRGMENMLRASRPNCLVEVTDGFLREMGDSSDALLDYFARLDYVCYMIGDNALSLIDPGHGNLPQQWNALFAPRETMRDLTGDIRHWPPGPPV